MSQSEREKKLLNSLDWLIFLIATVVLIVLILFYFVIPTINSISDEVKSFVQTLLTNLIPVPLLFVVSYAAYRRIQAIRDERDRDIFADNLATNLAEKLAMRESQQVLLDKSPESRENTLKVASELWLVGVALNKTVHANFSVLRERLSQGGRIRVLLVKPQGTCVSLVAQRKINNTDSSAMRHYINLTLATLCGLKKNFPEGIDIRVIDYPLSFGAIAADIESPTGTIHIEYYSFKTSRDGLYLIINSKDKLWYDYFYEQIRELWASSEEWPCDGTLESE